jgi:hypothetical protein
MVGRVNNNTRQREVLAMDMTGHNETVYCHDINRPTIILLSLVILSALDIFSSDCSHLKSSAFPVVCDRVRSLFLEDSRSPVGSNTMLSASVLNVK